MGAVATFLMPIDLSAARQVGGGYWEKRILPVGEIDYKGRKLQFTHDYLNDLAMAFNQKAYDQVPFQLAPDNNAHSNDPERFRGEIHSMRVGDDGLYVRMKPTPRGHAVLEENPRLGVSARIVEQYQRADGKFFPAAVQHVLGTLDPRIPDLGPWTYVEMSNETGQVIDLSDGEFPGEDTSMAGLTAAQQARLDRLLALSDEQFDAVLNGIYAEPDDLSDSEDLTDEELEGILADLDLLDDDDLAGLEAELEEDQLVGTSLSNYGGSTVELANMQLAEQGRQLSVMQRKMDADAYELEKQKFTRKGGLPPYLVEMARPLLEGTGHIVELSNGGGVDAGLVMRRVLTEVGKLTQMLDLDVELGSPMDEPDGASSQDRDQNIRSVVARYRNQTGI